MRCEDIQSLLSDHLNGALAPVEADGVEQHLLTCAECRQTLVELRWLAGLLQDVAPVAMPVELGARIHAALAGLDDVEVQPETGSSALRIPCDEAEDYLSGRLEGDLDEWEARALETHLVGCADCRLGADRLLAVRTLLRAVPQEPLPVTLAPRIFAALQALDEVNSVSSDPQACEEVREALSDYLEDEQSPVRVAVESHLESCAECKLQLQQLTAVRALLRAVPREPLPLGLTERVVAAIANEPAAVVPGPLVKVPLRRRLNWPSAVAGAVAAVALFFVWDLQSAKLPTIQTAAISTNTDVAVNIGFDVAESVDGVTFQIDLPEGLKFVDDKSHPMAAQSVAWRGALKQGQTVVPVVVRGVKAGRYEIQAYVSKGAMRKKTTIVLPVED